MIYAVLALLLALSMAANAYLWRKMTAASREPSYDARQLLHDLTAGSALVRIQRVAPEDIFLRSPRGV